MDRGERTVFVSYEKQVPKVIRLGNSGKFCGLIEEHSSKSVWLAILTVPVSDWRLLFFRACFVHRHRCLFAFIVSSGTAEACNIHQKPNPQPDLPMLVSLRNMGRLKRMQRLLRPLKRAVCVISGNQVPIRNCQRATCRVSRQYTHKSEYTGDFASWNQC